MRVSEGTHVSAAMEGGAPLSVLSSSGGAVPPAIAAGVAGMSAQMQGYETSSAFAEGTNPAINNGVTDAAPEMTGPSVSEPQLDSLEFSV